MPDPSASGPPPPPPLSSPRKPPLKAFGGYAIEGELGRGGMGVVYLARQIELNRHVALKMLTGHYGPDELRRFLEEGTDRITFACDLSGRYTAYPMVEPVVKGTKYC